MTRKSAGRFRSCALANAGYFPAWLPADFRFASFLSFIRKAWFSSFKRRYSNTRRTTKINCSRSNGFSRSHKRHCECTRGQRKCHAPPLSLRPESPGICS